MGAARVFAVVSWSGAVPIHLSPRGQRTQFLINGLGSYGRVERVGGDIPQWLAGGNERRKSSWYRRAARRLVLSVLIDKYELTARRALGIWEPEVDAAVLVGFPWSPLANAAGKLADRSIPFVVDVGDPWVLTNPYPEGNRLRRWRGRRQERSLWRAAAGAIVTTQGQSDALKRLFPHLRTLVRPNGYLPAEAAAPVVVPRSDDGDELRLVHYGSLYGERVDFAAIFRRLSESGRWQRISLCQYGPDWEGALATISGDVAVDHCPAIPWGQVLSEAGNFDAAVVIGWSNPAKMPSKAVQYLTLPLPRIAMTTSDGADSLATYLTDKPGWAVVNARSANAAEVVADQVARQWGDGDLSAPASESWDSVAQTLGAFVVDTTAGRVPATSENGG